MRMHLFSQFIYLVVACNKKKRLFSVSEIGGVLPHEGCLVMRDSSNLQQSLAWGLLFVIIRKLALLVTSLVKRTIGKGLYFTA